MMITAACGNSSDEASTGGADTPLSGQSMAFINASDANPTWLLLKDGVTSAATTAGVTMETYDNKMDAATVAENARMVAQSQPDMVLSYNPIEGIYGSIERIFEQADAPCIAINTPGTGYCSWFNLSNPELCTDTAKAVGTVAKEEGWTGDDTTVLLVNAPSFGELINNCNAYFYKEIANWIPGLEGIEDITDLKTTTSTIGESMVQVDGGALRGPSYDAVRSALSSIPEDRNLVIYTVADASTLGAWQAVDQAGRGDRSLVAGIGGDEEALKQLRTNPRWVAQGDIFFPYWGQYMMAMAAAIEQGVEIPFQTIVPEAVLTKDFAIDGTTVAPISEYYKDGESVAYQLPPLVTTGEGETVYGVKTVGNDYLAKTGILQLYDNVKDLEPAQ